MAKMELRGAPTVRGREKKMQQSYLQDAGAASEVNVVSESQRNVLKEVEMKSDTEFCNMEVIFNLGKSSFSGVVAMGGRFKCYKSEWKV